MINDAKENIYPYFIVSKLENLGRLRHDSEVRGSLQLSAFNDDVKIHRSFEVKMGPENYTFLVWRGTQEEVGLDVQGLISSCALPPITNRTRYLLAINMPIVM
jgi:hypothetical protein